LHISSLKVSLWQLLDALSLLHDARVIHYNLMPKNILLSRLSSHDVSYVV
jgi:dual specificity protein kinase YAK1